MSSDLEAVRRVIEAFDRSDWDEIDVRWGQVRVHLAAGSDPRQPAGEQTAEQPVAAARAAEDGADDGDDRGARGPDVPEGAQLVVAPSPGIFWRSPEPGAPPFTDLDQLVEPSSTLCIVEVMKLMSHLKAGVDGRVVAIYAENGTAIDQDQPLFAIVPAGALGQ